MNFVVSLLNGLKLALNFFFKCMIFSRQNYERDLLAPIPLGEFAKVEWMRTGKWRARLTFTLLLFMKLRDNIDI